MVTSKKSYLDRSIKSGHDLGEQQMTIEVTRKCEYKGAEYLKGERLKVTKSEAKKLFAIDRTLYRAVLD